MLLDDLISNYFKYYCKKNGIQLNLPNIKDL